MRINKNHYNFVTRRIDKGKKCFERIKSFKRLHANRGELIAEKFYAIRKRNYFFAF